MNDISSLDFNLLKALDVLLDERNVTRAAAKLSLTQPAVSNMLNRLRDKFDDPLFVRAPHGLIPTEKALTLAQPIKQILTNIQSLFQPVDFEPTSLQTTFKIAANDHDMQTIGLPFLLALKQQAPHVKIAFLTFNQLDIQTMLEKGELDLILNSPENTPEMLHSKTLFKERYVCVLRPNHPALTHGKISLDAFCQYEHVLVSYAGGKFSGVSDEALKKIGRSRKVTLSVTSFLLIPSILENSDYIAVVPELLTQHMPTLTVIETPITVQGYTKIMAWHERTHHNPTQKWLRDLMYHVTHKATIT